ncbi:MAG: acyl dehydratase [Paracoccaceae bacterium]|jgi:acyl dehydratase
MVSIDEYIGLVGTSLGHSAWMTIGQDRIDAFAGVTEDHQFIHVDVELAASESPFGGTIAHGFLTLSLLSHLSSQVFPSIRGKAMTFNYGMNKVRFLNPVKSGARVRVSIALKSAVEKQPGRFLCEFDSVVEIEGEDTPALVAEQVLMHVMQDAN